MFTNAKSLARLFTALDSDPNGATIFRKEIVEWLMELPLEEKADPMYYDPTLRRYLAFSRAGLMVSKSPMVISFVKLIMCYLNQVVYLYSLIKGSAVYVHQNFAI